MTLLSTHNLSITIAGKTICRELSLTIQPGDCIGLLGANGSGKTTLLQTLAGLYPKFWGEINLTGKSLQQLSRNYIAQHLAILFQEAHFIFPQTVYDYCLAARHPHAKNSLRDADIISEALAAVELTKFSAKNILTLSGGEKRRASLATTLAQTPQVFLLDEPTNHLDIRHQLRIMTHFKTICQAQSLGCLMALHDIHLAKRFCNKLIMLFEEGETLQGKTVEIFTPENLARLYQCDALKSIA